MAHSLVREYRSEITTDLVKVRRARRIICCALALLMVLLLMPEAGIAARTDVRDRIGSTSLMWAARRGHANLVRVLLLIGANINGEGWPSTAARPLIWAAQAGHANVVKLLLDKGADVNAKDDRGVTPLMIAADRGNLDIVRLLLDKGADVHARGNDPFTGCPFASPGNGWTALACAAYGGTLEVGTNLGPIGPNVSYADRNHGETPLRKYNKSDYYAIVKLLLEKGANVDAGWNGCWTPLRGAAKRGDLEVARLLLEKGARVNACNGCTPLAEAAGNGHSDMVEMLLDKGADVNGTDCDGFTALMIAAGAKHLKEVRKFHETFPEKRADVNAKTNQGRSADNLALVKLLVKKGADVSAENEHGTALDFARKAGKINIVQYLEACGARATTKGNDLKDIGFLRK
jgi:ankyrin repeat protein